MQLVTAKNAYKTSLFLYSDAGTSLLKVGKLFYPFIGEAGNFFLFGATFKGAPPADIYTIKNESRFLDSAEAVFKLKFTDLDTTHLKGSRVEPAYFEISKIKPDTRDGVQGVLVEGFLHNVYDPRLPFLDASESTKFGTGKFDIESVRALYDGSYFYAPLSAHADKIDRIVQEQKKLFEQLQTNPENTDNIKKELDKTIHLLKPHQDEIFKIEDDLYYFISDGKWRVLNLAGNRPIDKFDLRRIGQFFKRNDLFGTSKAVILESKRKSFYLTPLHDRLSVEELSPIFAKTIEQEFDSVEKEVLEYIRDQENTDLKDGVSEVVPGLKPGVELTGPQSFVVAKLKKSDRLLVDADPGAGKTLMQLVDILNQMAKGKVSRPLVVVPDSLVSQFAAETTKFTELNPWIITTESIRKWKTGDFEVFLQDAKAAPKNTVYIVGYHWLSHKYQEVPTGQMIFKNGRHQYRTTKVFTRPYRLLKDLGVDAVYFDEAHMLRSDSNLSHAASVLMKAPTVKALTGTIMPGNLVDVLGPMGVVHSAVLGSAEEFLEEYSQDGTLNSYKSNAPKEIRGKLKSYGVPQLRATAWASLLPKVTRKYHHVSFSKSQESAYNALLKNSLVEIEKDPKLRKAFSRFKNALEDGQLSLSPSLLARFIPMEVFVNSPVKAQQHLEILLSGEDAVSPKIKKIDQIVSEHLANPDNGKVLIFVQYEESAKAIYSNLSANLKNQAAIYKAGQVDILNRFKTENMLPKILVAVDHSLRTGHNLQIANCIIHADTLWVPGEMRQREARAARLKQKREVFIHHIIVENSAELLKNARIISQEHTISKANSDFDDTTSLPHVGMTLANMKDFRGAEKLDPFVERQTKIETFQQIQKEIEKRFFGTSLLTMRDYKSMEGQALKVVPSTVVFEGNLNDVSYIVDEELDKLPVNPPVQKVLKFNFQNWDTRWFLTSFKLADPQGFLRRLGFNLQPPYYYLEVPSKGGAASVISAVEKAGIEIINKQDLEKAIVSMKVLHPGRKGIFRELERESKKSLTAAADEEKLRLSFYFATIDGYPMVYTDSIRQGSKESQALSKIKFKDGPSFWYLPITRTILETVLKKLHSNYPEVRVADWEDFKKMSHQIFKLDLSEFDVSLGA